MAELVPCTSCERHIWSTEGNCPFCRRGRPRRVERESPRGDVAPLMGRAGVLALGAAGLAVLGCTDTQAVPVYGSPVVIVTGGGPANGFAPSNAGAPGGVGGMSPGMAGAPFAGGGTSVGGEGGAGGLAADASVVGPGVEVVDAGARDRDAGAEADPGFGGAPIAAVDLPLSGEDCAWRGAGITLPEGQSLSDFRSSAAPERVEAESCAVIGDPTRGYVISGHVDVAAYELTVTTRTALMAAGGEVDVLVEQPGMLPAEGLRSLQPCTARVLEVLPSGGAIFVQFSCSQVASPLEPSEACTVVDAGLILENCDK